MKKLVFALVFFSIKAFAFDSSQAYNVVTMSYTPNTTIYQNIVLEQTQQAQSSITFSVDVKNGGGRPTQNLDGVPQAYASQTDKAWVTIYAYNSSGALIGSQTSQQYTLQNWGSNSGWSAAPGDNLQPWSNASVTYNGSLSSVSYIKIEMKGTDGAFWAGNYGPEWRTPTVTIGSNTQNIVYNPEFGIAPNSVKAQGWLTSSGSWSNCGVTSGSLSCVTTESGVTANKWGGGYSVTGGTTSGQPGGYTSTLSTTTADVAATTGDPSSGTTPSEPVPVVEITTEQQNQVNLARARQTLGNKVYVTQIGHYNNIDVLQSGTYNLVDVLIDGDNNTTNVDQYGAKNYSRVEKTGNNNITNVYQSNSGGNVSGHHSGVTINGSSNSVAVTQTGDGEKLSFILIEGNNNNVTNLQTGTSNKYSDIKTTGNGHTVNLDQKDSGSHAARIELNNIGGSSNINVLQQGNTNQSYLLQQQCANANGCSVTVTQQ